ncbi:MAG: hypothetical protein KDD02_22410 [Phaeodactylibacter sp.]|nr:hypothetical protein [Phaeodactylibacter sp.]MCB9303368.1 hypothetical protein [Lewinellaceae bacterium]
MNDYRFERTARKNRQKALYFTVFFHLLLIGGIAYTTSGGSLNKILPAKIKAVLGIEQAEQATASESDLPRP